jgi:prepilin-type N-terminal cleavage/methylation domain-containing protein
MNKKGFTLIELLIVIAIIGILAVIAIPAYVGQQTRAARSEAYSNLQNLQLLEAQYFADQGNYTISLGIAAPPNQPNNVATIAAVLPGFQPGTGLNYSYWIVQNNQITNATTNPPTTGALTPCFVAWAYGNTGSRVSGDQFAIDCNNVRNF